VKLHTGRRGDGPLLLCHPGGPGFDGSELDDLGGLDRTRTLLLLDPRGSGGTGTAESYLLDDYVSDLEELRADLALETIDVLGFSHGALVAAAYAAAHPQQVRRLVLACGLAAVTDEMQEEAKRTIEGKAGEPWHAAAVSALEREEAGDYETPADVAAMWNAMAPLYFSKWDERFRPLVEVETLSPEPLRSFNATQFDLRPELHRIDAETLVITGRDDFICGPAAAAPLAEGIPGADLVVLDDAGHFAFLEQPEAFRAAVEVFLAAASG
jgi:pimeloyl-ACP methyl ester carboxylesterase